MSIRASESDRPRQRTSLCCIGSAASAVRLSRSRQNAYLMASLPIWPPAGYGSAPATPTQTSSIIRRAGDEGLSGITHLFNAMSQMQARAPGAVGAALDEARFTLGLICDGYHVDPAMMRIAFRAAGRDRLMLVTDAMPTVGAHGAGFDLFGHAIKLEGTRLATEDGTLAGAHLDMMGAVRGAVTLMRVSLEDALVMASRTPARFLGLDGRLGAIRKNYRADLVAFDPNLTVTDTWVAGIQERHG